uniref:Uncharacterized protein n=1 Tax=Anopheles atroparvus TaxID=41427 RepID=A0A182J9D1_ANOAO
MYSWRRASTIRLLLLLLTLAAILPSGQSQQRTRKPPASRHCTVTEDEFDSLVALLEDIEQEPTEGSEEDDETVEEPESSGQSTQCTRELARLRKSIRGLQESYHRLKESTVDSREYQLRKNRYEQQKGDLGAKLARLESQINSKHRSQINTLKRKIKDLEKQLNASVTELEKQRQQNVDHFINLVASQVNAGQQQSAANNFQKLMKYSTDPYAEIVKRVNVDWNMITFLRYVDFQHTPIAGYEALVDAMIARKSLRSWEALELLKHIQSILLARDGQQQQRAVALLKKFKMNAN